MFESEEFYGDDDDDELTLTEICQIMYFDIKDPKNSAFDVLEGLSECYNAMAIGFIALQHYVADPEEKLRVVNDLLNGYKDNIMSLIKQIEERIGAVEEG